MDKARRDLNVYSFLFWIDDFLKPRKTKCNIPNDIPSSILEGNEESSDEECLVEQFSETEEEEVPITKKTSEPKTIKTKKMKQTGMTLLEQKQMSIMEKMENELKEDKDNKIQDPEYLYAQSLAAELRNFGEVERCMIKHEINNIIFKYQMNK